MMNRPHCGRAPVERLVRFEVVDGLRIVYVNGGSPNPIKLEGRNDRRFRVPALRYDVHFKHFFRRFLVPLDAYLDEIGVCLSTQKGRDFLVSELAIRRQVERTLGVKFKDGRRGFRQWFLKHQPLARRKPGAGDNFRKDDRRKINGPACHFNPAMRIQLIDGEGVMTSRRVGKNNRIRACEVERRIPNDCFCV